MSSSRVAPTEAQGSGTEFQVSLPKDSPAHGEPGRELWQPKVQAHLYCLLMYRFLYTFVGQKMREFKLVSSSLIGEKKSSLELGRQVPKASWEIWGIHYPGVWPPDSGSHLLSPDSPQWLPWFPRAGPRPGPPLPSCPSRERCSLAQFQGWSG